MIEPNVMPTKHDFSYACSGNPTIGQLIEYGLTEPEARAEWTKRINRKKLTRKGRKYQTRGVR